MTEPNKTKNTDNYLWGNLFKKNSHATEIQIAIQKTPLFQKLNKKELKQLEQMVHVRHYRPQENIFRQGEVGVGMYIIIKGSVNISVSNYNSDAENQGVFVTRLVKDDFFGELSLVEINGRRAATATANEETMLIGFFKPDLIEISERRPYTGIKIMMQLGEILGTRLRKTTDKISELKRNFSNS